MNTIHLGQGLRWQHWLNVVKRQPGMQTVAIVGEQGNAAGSPEIFESDTAIPVYRSLEAARAEVPAQAAIVTGQDAVRFATQALQAGLAVVLDEPGVIDAGSARDLIALAQSSKCSLLVPQRYAYSSCEGALRRWIAQLGALGHISCSDVQPMPEDAGSGPLPGLQFSLAAASHLDSLARLFGGTPLSVMARAAGSGDKGAATEAFLTLDSALHIQYFGAVRAGVAEHTLWIEGTEGSLKTDGGSVWWRKRGWPVFVPVRIWPRPGPRPPEAQDAALLGQLANALRRPAVRQDPQHRVTLASMAAAVESARRNKPIEVADAMGLPAAPV